VTSKQQRWGEIEKHVENEEAIVAHKKKELRSKEVFFCTFFFLY
jgi:hypothetical protein